jgi:hypothetical protein
MKIDGRCHCGYMTFQAEADPDNAGICHCSDCQSLSGSAFRTFLRITDGSFRFLSGEPTVYVKVAESGAQREQHFAPVAAHQFMQRLSGRRLKSTRSDLAPYVSATSSSPRCKSGRAHDNVGSPISLPSNPSKRNERSYRAFLMLPVRIEPTTSVSSH